MTTAQLLSGWPIVRPGLLMAHVGPVLYVIIGDGIGEEGERIHLREIARAIDDLPTSFRRAGLYVFTGFEALTALGRNDLAKLQRDRLESIRRTTVAYAMVTQSPLARAAARAFFWMAPPPYPYAVESDLPSAVGFIARNLSGLDSVAVISGCEQFQRQYEAVSHLPKSG